MQTRQFALHLLVRLKTAISKIIDNKVTDGSRNREYNYDKLGRLTKVKGGVNGTLWNQQYAYDRWGNRTGITQTGTSGSGGAFIPLDGLASLSYNTATNRITSTNFAYDAAGNQTQSNENGQINTYKYDAAGRLVEVSSGGLTHTYAYGASNQRLQMVEAGAQGSTTLYVWAGGQTIAEYNGVGSGMAWTKSYVYLGGRLLATDSTSGVQYHHPDRLGTRLVTNTSGGIVSENIGLPFGNTITGESYNLAGSASKKRFTSYDRSDNTKLDYAVNRHYSAAQGRFTQVDPIGMNAVYLTNPQSLNLYSYCYNDPINHVDPDGLFIEAGAGGALGGVVGAIIGAVIGALRVIFGSRGPRTRMGARIERQVETVETGSEVIWSEPDIESGVGPVNSFGKKSATKKARRIIRKLPQRPPVYVPIRRLPSGKVEIELPQPPKTNARVGFPDNTIPDGARKSDPYKTDTYKLPENATRAQKAKYAAFRALEVAGKVLEVIGEVSKDIGGRVTIPVMIDPTYYCQFYSYPWCPKGIIIPRS